jgi:hypothetical protein
VERTGRQLHVESSARASPPFTNTLGSFGGDIARYRVGFVYTRCFLQKRLEPRDGLALVPLSPTGSAGVIHDARQAVAQARFPFNRRDLEATLKNFADTGHAILVEFARREAVSFEKAIDEAEHESEAAASAVALVAANPAVRLVGFAEGADSGLKFYVPKDRKIFHGTNVAGFLDAIPALEAAARTDPKLALLLKLYRSSLRDSDIDHQLLFQLILLEEASDSEAGATLAQRLRSFVGRHAALGSIEQVAQTAGVQLPAGKDVIDLLVALRNCAAHNGAITADGLTQYGAEWAVPILASKLELHGFVTEVLKVMFCSMVGYGPEQMMTLVKGPLEVRFD